jgi:hypothetical protein
MRFCNACFRAFSSEADTGLREENAQKQKAGATREAAMLKIGRSDLPPFAPSL